jgi:hypothetical protein
MKNQGYKYFAPTALKAKHQPPHRKVRGGFHFARSREWFFEVALKIAQPFKAGTWMKNENQSRKGRQMLSSLAGLYDLAL